MAVDLPRVSTIFFFIFKLLNIFEQDLTYRISFLILILELIQIVEPLLFSAGRELTQHKQKKKVIVYTVHP